MYFLADYASVALPHGIPPFRTRAFGPDATQIVANPAKGMAVSFYRSEQYSDIAVVVSAIRSGDEAPSKAARTTEAFAQAEGRILDQFPAHKMQLSIKSDVLTMMIDRSTDGIIRLSVEPDQLQALQCIFACIYDLPNSHKHAIKNQDGATLVRVMLLADSFAVPSAVAAAKKHLEHRTLSDTAIAALWGLGAWPDILFPLLLNSIRQNLGSSDTARVAAMNKLLAQLLGDVDEVLCSSNSLNRDLLFELPAQALVSLLESGGLRVLTEDTVLYTIAAWMDQHRSWWEPLKLPTPPVVTDYTPERGYRTYKDRFTLFSWSYNDYQSKERRRQETLRDVAQLIAHVRFTELSQLTLCTVVPNLTWLHLLGDAHRPWAAALRELANPQVSKWYAGARLLSCCPVQRDLQLSERTFSTCYTACRLSLSSDIVQQSKLVDVVFAGRKWCAAWELHKGADSISLHARLGPEFPGVPQDALLWQMNVTAVAHGKPVQWQSTGKVLGAVRSEPLLTVPLVGGEVSEEAWYSGLAAAGLPSEPNDKLTAVFTLSM